jgi:hypothetical protein
MDPNPPSRKDEDFPKTNTIPAGWVMDELTAAYNPVIAQEKVEAMPIPPTGRKNACENGGEKTTPHSEEELFARRLDPFPAPGDAHGKYL